MAATAATSAATEKGDVVMARATVAHAVRIKAKGAPVRQGPAVPAQPPAWQPAIMLPPPDLAPVPADRFAGAKSVRLTPEEQDAARKECYWLDPPLLKKHPPPPEHFLRVRPTSWGTDLRCSYSALL